MSATMWIVAAALVAAMLALAAVLLLRGRSGAALTESSAVEAAQSGIAGFTARQALIGDDRRKALVVGEHRRVTLIVSQGQRARAREIRWSDIRATEGGLHIAAARGSGTVFVGGIDVLEIRRAGDDDWRRR